MSARKNFTANTHSESYDFISPLKLDMSGRTVVITGTAWEDGVGQATAIAFARAGARAIGLIDLKQVSPRSIATIEGAAVDAGKMKPLVKSYAVDISNLTAVQTTQKEIVNDFGERLDVLVNNAAHQEPYKTILDSDPDTDWRTWEVNLHGLLNMTRTFLPGLLSTHTLHNSLATVINVASSGALSARAGSANYRSSKLAILRWTEILQLDHKEQGLLAFCVNPGAIKTQMTINEPEELRAKLPHKPSIAGDTIVWLAAERREWLGGRYVSCPWDMEELLNRKEEIVSGDKLKMAMVF
jgi:NAD(P)-dependent dehydrogenase (short-subunit alcohol dehydrogenase family)